MTLRGLAGRACGAMLAALLVAPVAVRADEPDKVLKIGVVYDLTGPFAGGGSELQYLGAKIIIDWFNAAWRHRRLQGRADLRRRAEQARCRDQRGRPPDRAGEGRHAARLLLLRRVRAGGGARRAVQEIHVDHHLHRLAGAGRPQPAIRLPAAALSARQWGLDLDRDGRRPTPRRSSARTRRIYKSPSSTRTAPTAAMSPRVTPRARRRPGSRS